MNVAGLAINIPGVIDVCIKLGTHIAGIIGIYRKANSYAEDIAHKFDLKWNNIVDILEGVNIMHESLDDALKTEIITIIDRLCSLLVEAISEASRAGLGPGYNPVTNPTIRLSTYQTMQFATYKKERLQKLLDHIESWEKSMYQRLTVIGAKTLVRQLARRITVPVLQPNPIPRNFRASTGQGLQFPQTDVVLQWRPPKDLFGIKYSNISRSISRPDILVEFRYYDASAVDIVELQTNVYGIVKMLKSADPSVMSILKCQGVYASQPDEPSRFELQYCLPQDLDYPRSLRDLLTDRSVRKLHPLNHRFRLANNLAASVLYVHSGEFVHKCIKPENILIMTKASAPPEEGFPHVLGLPFLVGFDRCRPANAHSGKYGEIKFEDCLYQHPTRWGVTAEEAFAMQHDIYSLGVVLLEIGLWQPLVWQNEMRGTYEYTDLFNQECFRSERNHHD